MKKLLFLVLLVVVGIQFIEPEKSNPPVSEEIDVPPLVLNILEKSCYDCHSNTTNWPLYSYIAPISWLVVNHVNEGRAELNFSEWDKVSYKKNMTLKRKILKTISEDSMPLLSYKFMHPQAEISYDEKQILKKWFAVK